MAIGSHQAARLIYVKLGFYCEICCFGLGSYATYHITREDHISGRNLKVQFPGCDTQVFSYCLYHKQKPWQQAQHLMLKLHIIHMIINETMHPTLHWNGFEIKSRLFSNHTSYQKDIQGMVIFPEFSRAGKPTGF